MCYVAGLYFTLHYSCISRNQVSVGSLNNHKNSRLAHSHSARAWSAPTENTTGHTKLWQTQPPALQHFLLLTQAMLSCCLLPTLTALPVTFFSHIFKPISQQQLFLLTSLSRQFPKFSELLKSEALLLVSPVTPLHTVIQNNRL